jgi:hypothetical protein
MAENTNMSQYALQDKHRVRARVRGNNGPDRKLLPTFQQLGEYDEASFRSLKDLVMARIASHPDGYSDINNADVYEIAQACELKDYFHPTYRQLLLQTTGDRPDGADNVPDEWEYLNYQEPRFEPLINQFVNPHFRSRIAIAPPKGTVGWHIDTNTNYACRVSIMIQGIQEFKIERNGKTETQVMKPGEVWFKNTGYNHCVEVLSDEPRIVIITGCFYQAIEDMVPCLG